MKVKILIEFEVFNLEEGDVNDVTEAVAKSAASMAAYDHLCFTENLGRSAGVETVQVHVDGHGECEVKIGEDHE